ncbi:MAG: hypothetical protein EOP49_15560 [Sphingobacteriales bacterium]|nr:MAG: hypothetical protein EOP49_15560 [Sphingobacteriales bacterium]
MQQGLLHLHNFMRWVVLLMAIITIVKSLSGMSGKRAFTNGDRKTALFLMISADIQLLLGFALYFMRGWFDTLSAGGNVMADKVSRFWSVEHIAGMLLGIILIHVGYSASKKNITDSAKFSKLFWFTLIALIVILATIPWPFREAGIAKPWFPGMG